MNNIIKVLQHWSLKPAPDPSLGASVRLTHIPTGFFVESSEHRKFHENLAMAYLNFGYVLEGVLFTAQPEDFKIEVFKVTG